MYLDLLFNLIRRWGVLTVWVIGLPFGFYLTFIDRPTAGLEGIWIGLIVGMTLLATILVLQVLLLDWEKEERKAEYRLRRSGYVAPQGGVEEEEHANTINPLQNTPSNNETTTTEIVAGTASGSVAPRGANSSTFDANIMALPVIGSMAVGGLPLDQLFFSARDELNEFEFVEFGHLQTQSQSQPQPPLQHEHQEKQVELLQQQQQYSRRGESKKRPKRIKVRVEDDEDDDDDDEEEGNVDVDHKRV